MDNQQIINKLLTDKQLTKALLVLGIKQVTWRNELTYDFEIHHDKVNRFIEYMEELGFIASKRLYEIDEVLYFTLIEMNPKQFYFQSPSVFTLTPNGKEFIKYALDYVAKNLSSNQTLAILFSYVSSRTKYFRDKMIYVHNRETDNDNIYYTFPSGEMILKKTISARLKEEELKKALIQAKKEILIAKNNTSLIENTEKNSIIQSKHSEISIRNNNSNIRKLEFSYSGEFSSLPKNQIEELSEGVSIEQEKELKKESKKEIEEINEAMKDDTGIYSLIRIPIREGLKNGMKAKLRFNEEKEDKLCCDLLNNFGGEKIKNKTRFVWL